MQIWRRESDEVGADVADGHVTWALDAQALPGREHYLRATLKSNCAAGLEKMDGLA
jgi:hypothetical protein